MLSHGTFTEQEAPAHLDGDKQSHFKEDELLLDTISNRLVHLLTVVVLRALEIPEATKHGKGITQNDTKRAMKWIVLYRHLLPVAMGEQEGTLRDLACDLRCRHCSLGRRRMDH